MGIMNGLTFGGINSLDYGIYISGDAVFNAPGREVEMLQIPGRNGDYVLDHGRFENIEVSYPAGTFGDDQTDFREKLSDFRNAILSQPGYQRLTDTYHPDEYRMGVYASGLEVDPVHYNTAGEFVLTFNCKPQRWLTSGETATSIADGGTVTNPTLFEASPLLEVEGYGNIDIGGQDIDIENVQVGYYIINEDNREYSGGTRSFDTSMFNNGDTINARLSFAVRYKASGNYTVASIAIDTETNCDAYTASITGGKEIIVVNDMEVQKGTASTHSSSITYTVRITSPSTTTQITLNCVISYNGSGTFSFAITGAYSVTHTSSELRYKYTKIDGTSTKSALGNPMYIDLDIGECWNEDYGKPVSVNDAVSLGSELPTLSPGATTINYDNTITDLKIAPRWWKV